jgi:hypothetical protein
VRPPYNQGEFREQGVSFAMVLPERPISLEARFRERYQARLRARALQSLGAGHQLTGNLYVRILWLHRLPTNQDIDNIAKRILDALKGVAFPDDGIVVSCLTRKLLYSAQPISLPSRPDVPQHVFEQLIELLGQDEPHILYIEAGQFASSQIVFGPAY